MVELDDFIIAQCKGVSPPLLSFSFNKVLSFFINKFTISLCSFAAAIWIAIAPSISSLALILQLAFKRAETIWEFPIYEAYNKGVSPPKYQPFEEVTS